MMKKILHFLILILIQITASIAFGASSTLYISDLADLYSFSTTNNSLAYVGPYGASGYMVGLTYDSNHDILYGTTAYGAEASTNNLYTIDRVTGAAHLIGTLGTSLMHGLAYDNQTDRLYGTYGDVQDGFYQIDTTTGKASLIGHTYYEDVCGLAFDPTTHILYGCTWAGGHGIGELITIDPTTGQSTPIAPTGSFSGMGFNPETGILYAVDNGSGRFDKLLCTIDLHNGNYSVIESLNNLYNPLTLAFVAVPEPSTIVLLFSASLGGLLWWRRR